VNDDKEVKLTLSDNSELVSLQRTLTLARSVRIERVAGTQGAGKLGTVDYLVATGATSALVTLIKMLPDFLRARRADLSVEISRKDSTVKVTTNRKIDEVMPALKELLDD
jgi:hypothetical protein